MLEFGDVLEGDPRFKYWLTKEFIDHSQYEKYNTVKKGDVVLDIGSSIGPFLYTIQNRNVSKVIAVEPLTAYHQTLHKNAGDLPLTLYKNAIGDNDNNDLELEWSSYKENVKTISFDTIIKENNLTHIDFFKIDCEGGEYSIFNETYIDWIKENISYISGEFHLNTPEMTKSFIKMYELLKEKGFNFIIEDVIGNPIDSFFQEDLKFNATRYEQVNLFIDNRQVKKLLYIAPHLSTGGLPQYLTKKIELLKDEYEIYLVEWQDVTGGRLVVTKNKIKALLPEDRFYTLGENKNEILKLIDDIQPDIIHMEEIPELAHFPRDITEKIYKPNRPYKIVETSHDSSFNTNNKQFFPDMFMFVSQWQIDQYKDINIPKVLVEYPIEYIDRPDRVEALQKLGLDPNKKHVLHIGLFTPRKNQAEFFEYAKMLPDVEFHCVGNQADNFKWYWKPLMETKPDNVTWWNERTDVDNFYQSMDLFLFTSKGTKTDKETMPLVIREAISYQIPLLIYNLEVYQNYFDKFDKVNYLDFNSKEENKNIILNALNEEIKINIENEAYLVATYPNNSKVEKMTIDCLKSLKQDKRKIITISHCPVSKEIQELSDFVIYDKNNVTTRHTFNWYFYHNSDKFDLTLNVSNSGNDFYHGPACHNNIYNAASLASKLGITKLYHINYDYSLKDKSYIDKISSLLNTHSVYSYKILEGNGDVPQMKTAFVAFKSDDFVSKFPYINNKQEWDDLQLQKGAPSNGLESIWYQYYKNDPKAYWDTEKNVNNLIENALDFKDFSQVEYFAVLPYKDKMVVYLRSSNKEDSRIFKVSQDNNQLFSIDVTQPLNYYMILDKKECELLLEIYDIETNEFIDNKKLILDTNYLDNILPNNGTFILK